MKKQTGGQSGGWPPVRACRLVEVVELCCRISHVLLKRPAGKNSPAARLMRALSELVFSSLQEGH